MPDRGFQEVVCELRASARSIEDWYHFHNAEYTKAGLDRAKKLIEELTPYINEMEESDEET